MKRALSLMLFLSSCQAAFDRDAKQIIEPRILAVAATPQIIGEDTPVTLETLAVGFTDAPTIAYWACPFTGALSSPQSCIDDGFPLPQSFTLSDFGPLPQFPQEARVWPCGGVAVTLLAQATGDGETLYATKTIELVDYDPVDFSPPSIEVLTQTNTQETIDISLRFSRGRLDERCDVGTEELRVDYFAADGELLQSDRVFEEDAPVPYEHDNKVLQAGSDARAWVILKDEPRRSVSWLEFSRP